MSGSGWICGLRSSRDFGGPGADHGVGTRPRCRARTCSKEWAGRCHRPRPIPVPGEAKDLREPLDLHGKVGCRVPVSKAPRGPPRSGAPIRFRDLGRRLLAVLTATPFVLDSRSGAIILFGAPRPARRPVCGASAASPGPRPPSPAGPGRGRTPARAGPRSASSACRRR